MVLVWGSGHIHTRPYTSSTIGIEVVCSERKNGKRFPFLPFIPSFSTFCAQRALSRSLIPTSLSAPISSRIFVIRELPSVSIFSVRRAGRRALHSADSRGIRLFVLTIGAAATLSPRRRSHNAPLEQPGFASSFHDDNEVCLVPEIMAQARYKLRASAFKRVST